MKVIDPSHKIEVSDKLKIEMTNAMMTQTHLCEHNYQMLQKQLSRKDVRICFNKCSRQYENCSSSEISSYGLKRSFTFFSYTLVI